MAAAALTIQSPLENLSKAITDQYEAHIKNLQYKCKLLTESLLQSIDAANGSEHGFALTKKQLDVSYDRCSLTRDVTSISARVPEVTFEQNTITINVPSVRMRTDYVTARPEIRENTVEWIPIHIELPEAFMEQRKLTYTLPSVTMKQREWHIPTPRLAVERLRLFIEVPELTIQTVVQVNQQLLDFEKEIKDEAMQADLVRSNLTATLVSGSNAMNVQATIAARLEITDKFNAAVASLTQAIAILTAEGVDPIKVPSETNEINLRKQLTELIVSREAALAAFETTAPAAVANTMAEETKTAPVD